jgi:hypothetical protein
VPKAPLLPAFFATVLALCAPAWAADPAPGAAAEGNIRVLLMDLVADGAPPETARSIGGLTAVQLAEDPTLTVISGEDVRSMAELEANKQSLGCQSDTSCLAEIAGALDAELVVFGRVGALGDSVLVTLNLFDVKKAVAVGRVSLQAKDLSLVPRLLAPRLRELFRPVLTARYGRELMVHDPEGFEIAAQPASKSPMPVVVASTGGAMLLVGTSLALLGLLPQAMIGAAEERFDKDPAAAAAEARDWQGWYPLAEDLHGIGLIGVGLGSLVLIFGVGWMAVQ